MSQDISTNSSVLDQAVLDQVVLDQAVLGEEVSESESDRADSNSIDLVGDGTFPMDYHANSLMDDLFREVDRMLEGGSLPLETSEPPAEISLQPIAIPRLDLPAMHSVLAPLESDTAIATQPDADESIATLEAAAAKSSSLHRWLLAAACASAIAAAVSWLVFLRPSVPSAAPVSTAPSAQADPQFMSYVQRSLDRIRSRSEPAAAPSAALPSVSVASSGVPAGASPSALDRVYVPVYQPPQTLYPVAPVVPVAPIVPPVALAPAARTATAPAAAAAAPAIAPQQTLIGVLQFGDRSAALFEVGGSPQRISVGETIGASGWTLVSVANDAAVIRRNGEVRSIYVGQQF